MSEKIIIQKPFYFGEEYEEKIDEKYTHKIQIPQYNITGKCPDIYELYDYSKYKQLVKNINKLNIDEELKTFLTFAATRHIVFNYANIAEYYAHQTKEIQELFEESALVIIDFNDAIANGYVKLSDDIKNIIEKESL